MLGKSALFQTQLWHLWLGLLLLSVPLLQTTAVSEELKGGLIVVGRGPERTIIEQLTQAFEKDHFGIAVDIRWNRNFHIATMVASGEADIAVSGREELGLTAATIAWDGLAVIVNFSCTREGYPVAEARQLLNVRSLRASNLSGSLDALSLKTEKLRIDVQRARFELEVSKGEWVRKTDISREWRRSVIVVRDRFKN